ncbi:MULTISPECIES: hypothetical protein [Ralstonia solanacearum species complex]|uniref:Uncharacterized protein n=1 Tax=Ralstonia solanacearum TaxID=305 RepID=A0AAE3V247_RALSL|nr:hypothetical protein [Ralstonia solanacearum]MBB6581585.1 hypothetical protein [Ralstonia solanacearum]MDB0524711.1 hypothetical protein [Ralstonia solanacearum]MDN4063190.1 hypothetical protein [Ralstonia solanacearum]NUU70426.1 hypothetical protein [Ralstonia solanacearum]QHB55309.1 hypothetical protein GRB31_09570 [Ralstonia solanacearum]
MTVSLCRAGVPAAHGIGRAAAFFEEDGKILGDAPAGGAGFAVQLCNEMRGSHQVCCHTVDAGPGSGHAFKRGTPHAVVEAALAYCIRAFAAGCIGLLASVNDDGAGCVFNAIAVTRLWIF